MRDCDNQMQDVSNYKNCQFPVAMCAGDVSGDKGRAVSL